MQLNGASFAAKAGMKNVGAIFYDRGGQCGNSAVEVALLN